PCPPKTHTKGDGAGDIGMCKKEDDDEDALMSMVQDPLVAGPVAIGLVVIIVVAAVVVVRRRNKREMGRKTGALPAPLFSSATERGVGEGEDAEDAQSPKSGEVAMSSLTNAPP